MKYFIVGDVHGCVNTYKAFLEKYWNPQKEILIQVGDIANKGKFTYETILFSMELSKKYPENFVQLKGNNDHILYKELQEKGFSKEIKQLLEEREIEEDSVVNWLGGLLHFWENDTIFVSHAGVDKNNNYPVKEDDLRIVYTREKLKNIGKMQFIGHVLVEAPFYNKEKNIWYLDTGAGFRKKLSGVKVKLNGKVTDIISTKVKKKDFLG
ncbi:protein-serine/threonine phosphatase [Flavobacteriaceae bacterium UJ101]|nr:protein-serine/threonine phosphatase [Flavobacteriaceae bacterium UJ101]